MSFGQNVEFLSMLSCKTKDQFDKFMDALENSEQQYIRSRITSCRGQSNDEIVYSCLV